MQSSIRVMPSCFLTGQAAGFAASLAAAGSCDIRGVDVGALRVALRETGLFLPN
jgi:hypothetical protein